MQGFNSSAKYFRALGREPSSDLASMPLTRGNWPVLDEHSAGYCVTNFFQGCQLCLTRSSLSAQICSVSDDRVVGPSSLTSLYLQSPTVHPEAEQSLLLPPSTVTNMLGLSTFSCVQSISKYKFFFASLARLAVIPAARLNSLGTQITESSLSRHGDHPLSRRSINCPAIFRKTGT